MALSWPPHISNRNTLSHLPTLSFICRCRTNCLSSASPRLGKLANMQRLAQALLRQPMMGQLASETRCISGLQASCSALGTEISEAQASSRPTTSYGHLFQLSSSFHSGTRRLSAAGSAALSVLPSSQSSLGLAASSWLGASLRHSQERGVFGFQEAKKPNPQIHTHKKYQQTYPQPTYE